jgi:hypothetical protein
MQYIPDDCSMAQHLLACDGNFLCDADVEHHQHTVIFFWKYSTLEIRQSQLPSQQGSNEASSLGDNPQPLHVDNQPLDGRTLPLDTNKICIWLIIPAAFTQNDDCERALLLRALH